MNMEDTKVEEGFKRCSKCGEVKPISEFYKRKSSKDGLRSECKACIRARVSEYYANHKEEKKAYNAEWRSKNPNYYEDYYDPQKNPIGYAKHMVKHYRWMDRERGFDDSKTITAEWFVQNIMYKPCAHCGLLQVGAIGANRIDNTKGHTEDNVEAACLSCNASLGVKDAIERGLHWTCKRKANQSFKYYVNEHNKQSFSSFVEEHKAKHKKD